METNRRINIKVDASKVIGELKHSWRYAGYDECNYTQTPEGKALIEKFGKLGDAPYYFRTHHLFCTGSCHSTYKWGSTNVYTEDEKGNAVYNWETLDEILDIYINSGNKPFFELGFMPMALVNDKYAPTGVPWSHYGQYKNAGWASAPKDYMKWYGLVYNTVKHCIERYGREEVLTWYWELWNEPDLGYYWKGTKEEYFELFDYTEAAVHEALPGARLGGPGTTDPRPGSYALEFLEAFLEHCSAGTNYHQGNKGTRLDFVTFHTKGGGFPFILNAPKDMPSVKKQVEQVKTGLEAITKYGYEGLEVVLSEADPDGWAAGGMYDNRNMVFRNTEYYATYVASGYHGIERVAAAMNMDVRPLAWAFMFIGERCFEGTRTFSTWGIDKSVFNMFKVYSKLGNVRLSFESSGEKDVLGFKDNFGTGEEPNVSGMAAMSDSGDVQILIFSHHDDREFNLEQEIEVDIAGIVSPEDLLLSHYRIDSSHSNAYSEWVRQGSPKYPDNETYSAIKSRDGLELLCPPRKVSPEDGKLKLKFTLPAHGVSLLELAKA